MTTEKPTPRRRDTPRSSGKAVILTPRDLVWFEMLHRHGALPVNYLHAFTADTKTSLDASKNRMTLLFHEANTKHRGQYLGRPFQQWATFEAMKNELVYELAPAAEDALRQAGKWHDRAPHTSPNHWRHDFMISCITASIHIATLGTEHRFIFQDEILERADANMTFDVGYRMNGKNVPLRPDRMFGIEYPDGGVRLFIVEADCSTEPIRSTFQRKSFARNVEQYQRFIGKGIYKDALKVQGGVLVMFVTNTEQRMKHMMEIVEDASGGRCAYALFAFLTQFTRYFQPPEVLPQLFTDPWERVGTVPFSIPQT